MLFLCVFISGCEKPLNQLEHVLEKKELTVLTRYDATTYFKTNGKEDGFEFALVNLFADYLGVKARFTISSDFSSLIHAIELNRADFSAAGLSVTNNRKDTVLFTPPYYEVTQQLIYHYRSRRPRSLASINDEDFFEVLFNSSHAENLRSLQTEHRALAWDENNNASTLELVDDVSEGLLDYTVVDSNQFPRYHVMYPQLNIAFDVSKPEHIAWAFPKTTDTSLYDKAVEFIKLITEDGTLAELQNQYFGYKQTLDYVSICAFNHHVATRLPDLKEHFQQAAAFYQLDWKLIAAIGYQESHWNADAVSPTGVKGIMMLTNPTAKQVGVSDRLDPRQSIHGGTKYFASRLKRIPDRITEPDKTWMALAAYNVGFGHLEDARVLTQKQGGDPDKWMDVRERLPLLSQKKWYSQTKHGYARGHEPVQYVKNIRRYYDFLTPLELHSLEDDDTLSLDKAPTAL